MSGAQGLQAAGGLSWSGPAAAHAEAVHSILRLAMSELPNVLAVEVCAGGDEAGFTAGALIAPHDGGSPIDFSLGVGEHASECDAAIPIAMGDPPETTARNALSAILENTGAAGDRERALLLKVDSQFAVP